MARTACSAAPWLLSVDRNAPFEPDVCVRRCPILGLPAAKALNRPGCRLPQLRRQGPARTRWTTHRPDSQFEVADRPEIAAHIAEGSSPCCLPRFLRIT